MGALSSKVRENPNYALISKCGTNRSSLVSATMGGPVPSRLTHGEAIRPPDLPAPNEAMPAPGRIEIFLGRGLRTRPRAEKRGRSTAVDGPIVERMTGSPRLLLPFLLS